MRFVVEMSAVLALLMTSLKASGQSANPSHGLVGAVECAACHRGEFEAQSQSEHAHALSRPAEHALAREFASSSDFVRSGKHRFHFFSAEGALRVRAWDNTDQIEIPLDWAFGAGEQAVTFVSRIDSEWYLENALSYYSAFRSYALTPGQQDARRESLKTAVGRIYRTDDTIGGITGCFECHSTGPVTRDAAGALRPHEAGVRCEACHGEGSAHKTAALSHNRKQAISSIANPGRMTAQELNLFCGKCHRAQSTEGVETDWNVAWNVRHQPIYFSQSACFRQSRGAFSCITCHDPHTRLIRSDSSYNAKCRECHNQAERKPAKACGDTNTSNCVECHMPTVSPQPWLRFTNHWIGVYSGGGKLKPRR
ncbi:MAG TPA: multiheme c-type cytochrome [Bryobacteraceae bacterium]|nr:multiheme c-type cytochrome [Bryobacteraceae bacterium]